MLMLLAETPATEAGKTAVLLAVASSLGFAAKWVWDAFISFRATRMGEKAAEQKTIVDHMQAAIIRLETEAKNSHVREEEMRIRMSAVELTAAYMIAHIRYLETILKKAGEEFIPWKPPGPDDLVPGSGVHAP